ncbi:MAG: LysM peptidoglycan-binding domain-containing protein [Butyrivibrio sp.]|nr:LysM peptidoglycan-binding domain-containing protein [Butyrivibrio sp.]
MENVLYSNVSVNSRIDNSRSEERIRRNRIRRQRIIRRQYTVLFSLITIILFLGIFMFSTILSDARSDDNIPDIKYYKTITVHTGDTLLDIATEYYADEHYKSINGYLFEICTINKIKDADHLNAGESLIIPYFSSEFK